MINLVIFGPPGAGKGTQSTRITSHFDLFHISTGDIFRKHVKEETEIGLRVQSYLNAGKLVPDDVVIEILGKTIDQETSANGFVFDGFPRTINQAEALDKMLSQKGMQIDIVISLVADEETLIHRLLRRANLEGRKDDTQKVIEERLNVYQKQTKPLIDYYDKQDKLSEIDGIGDIDEIFEKRTKPVIEKTLKQQS